MKPLTHMLRLSVVVPSLNRADYLRPTLDSILAQDYPEIECLVVDGGSSDGTLDILKSYSDRIRWISEPDQGFGDAINKGWQATQGEVLAWLNADDVWEVPGAVSTAMAYLREHPNTDVVYGDCAGIDGEGRLVDMAYLYPWDLQHAVLECDHCIPQPAAFVRRSAVERVGWLDTSLLKVDHDLWLRVGLTGRIEHLPTVLARARRIPGHSAQVERIAEDCIQISAKALKNPDLPRSLQRQRRRIMGGANVRALRYVAGAGEWRLARRYASQALRHDPGRALSVARILADQPRGSSPIPFGPVLKGSFRLGKKIPTVTRRLFQEKSLHVQARSPNLLGDREIEWSWIMAQIPPGPGRVLDFGAGGGPLGIMAAFRGHTVHRIDLCPHVLHYQHPNLHTIRGDLLKLPLVPRSYNAVLSCSTVEHVGISGRYGIDKKNNDGDLDAMRALHDLLRDDGLLIMTIPVGKDQVYLPNGRVYGEHRLPLLFDGFIVQKQEFFHKNADNVWRPSDRQQALGASTRCDAPWPIQNYYALGCFVLKKGTPC